ncbi:MAG TPA: hypothetical protein VEK37_04890 [Gemmatimonadaceae bacterium]|nr:hypothetical protein [Gemmatimonadaceae bacterium]
MIRIPKSHRARGLVPCVATILSLSLAATLRIERSCSAEPFPPPAAPAVLYPYPEIVAFYRNDAISIAAARGIPIAPATNGQPIRKSGHSQE